jgi:hypothetical protein
MKFCLRLTLVVVLILQLAGVGVGTYYVAPNEMELPYAELVNRVDVDQQRGTYKVEYRKDDGYWDHVDGYGMGGIPPELMAAAIIPIDRGRFNSNMLRVVGNVQRGRTAEQSISAINRIRHVNDSVLATMPVGHGPEQVTLHYFRLESALFSPEQLASEYKRRGLVPDPQAQIADNEQDPSLAYDYPNATQWLVSNGTSHSLTFDDGTVSCDRCNAWVGGDWWFAGVERS